MKALIASPSRRAYSVGIRGALLVSLLGAVASLGTAAWATPLVVTVCGRDDAPGGLNLASALTQGGEIVIRCPAGQSVIEFTRTHETRSIVSIDGEGKVTLRGPVAGPLFKPDMALRLSHLTVANPRTAATANAPGAGTIILGPESSVELDDVITQDSGSAYVVKSLIARDSKFLRNGDPAAQVPSDAVVNAEFIELRHIEFTENFNHPIAGGSPPTPGRAALSRRILIEDSVFTGNRSTMLLTDAKVSIRQTRFEANGTTPEKSGGAWGCCGGAMTLVRSDADLLDTTFRSNGSAGFGGAIYALGSKLRITQSVFEGNNARVGGAVMFWGRRPKVNIWSTDDWLDPPQLELRRTQFRANKATLIGGGLAFAGDVEGDGVLFQTNVSGGAGGAIADLGTSILPDPYGEVLDALVKATEPPQSDSISLARPILVDNRAASGGAAIASGSAVVTIGNGLIARNQLTGKSGGGTVSGAKVTLVNTTLADNPAGGIVVTAGATARLGNTILLRNAGFNCTLTGTLSDAGHNIQYPGSDCGAPAAVRDPGLDGEYAPGLFSAARGAGDIGLCATDPQVRGIDLFGKPRLEGGRCDAGAIEQPVPQTIASALGLGSGRDSVLRLLWLLVLLVLLFFLFGLLWTVRRRRRADPEPPND